MQRYAAIDSGTNTFRLLIAESATDSNPPWQIIHYTHHITRLGAGLHHSGELSETGMQRGIAAYSEFSAALKQHHISPEHTLATATAAVREASNGAEFCQRVEQQTGLHIQVIDGQREALWSLNGACAVLDSDIRQNMLLFDIGGGSTEFIRASHGIQHDAISCKLGVVRLVEAYLHSDPPSKSDYQALKTAAIAHLDVVETSWKDSRKDGQAPQHLVGTAGTITTLAATALNLYPYDAAQINNYRMSKADFLSLRDRLLAMDNAQRASLPTIEAGRADLIIAGLAIIEAVMQRWGYEETIAVDASLLEGIWLKISQ